MAYATAKKQSGREPVSIVELDLDFCSLSFGVGACTASASTGLECFNTFGTCQDAGNYAKTTKTYRFSTTRMDSLDSFPTLGNVSTSPTILTPGKGFGVRSQVTASIQDHTWTDVGVDPYYSTRSYTPEDQGTFWGKLIARNKYTEGRVMRIKTGYLDENGDYDASNFITRTYFLDKITGPDKNGKVTLTGRDILRFTDNSKAQLPEQSTATLDADITDVVTSFDISDPDDNVKDAYDNSQPYIRIDDEVMEVTNITGSSGNYTLTVTRGTIPSYYNGSVDNVAHNEGATVQQCYNFFEQEVDNIVNYLLGTVAGIDSSYLPTTDWQTVINTGLQSYLFSALITEPTGVKDLLEEITEHTILLWYDEREQEVKMGSLILRPTSISTVNDEDNMVKDSVNYVRDDSQRVSRVWVSHGLRSPVLEMDELKNYEVTKIAIDQDTETDDTYGQKRVLRIWSRWLPSDRVSVASEIASRLLSYYSTTKKVITFTLDPKDDELWTGDVVLATTRQVQDEFGASDTLEYRVLEVNELNAKGQTLYKYTLMSNNEIDVGRYGKIGPNTLGDYSTESDANKAEYAFISPNSGNFPDGGEPYVII